MEYIYFDNGATSHPKAPGLGNAMAHYLEQVGANMNRGSYESATVTAMEAFKTREKLGKLFGFSDPSHVVFTAGVTHSLNQIIKGVLKAGDHCLITGMEHNAVYRPVVQLSQQGVTFDIVPCDGEGRLMLDKIPSLIKPNTKMAIFIHGSNVSGTIQPIKEAAELLHAHQIKVVLDCAQTAGHIPIDFHDLGLSALAFTGHKGLLGPAGIGGMLLSKDIAQEMNSLIAGGTGSFSDSPDMPKCMPDKFEAGTLNIPGIFGLSHSLDYLEKIGVESIREKEKELATLFLAQIAELNHVAIAGPVEWNTRVAVVSLNFLNKDNAEVAYRLEKDHGILTRCGLHCAPLAHQSLGTYPSGTVRFSFSHFNTKEEIERGIAAIYQVIK